VKSQASIGHFSKESAVRYMTLLLTVIAISGCDMSYGNRHANFSLFETSKGTIYLLNTTSGETKIIYSTDSEPKLVTHNIYKAEDGKTYEYQGAGRLRELTIQEAADKIIEKYK
jgi:hypothetical protein